MEVVNQLKVFRQLRILRGLFHQVPPLTLLRKGKFITNFFDIWSFNGSDHGMEWFVQPSLIRAGQPLVVSQGEGIGSNDNATPALKNESAIVPVEEGGSLQDFFNDSSGEDRPIIDAP